MDSLKSVSSSEGMSDWLALVSSSDEDAQSSQLSWTGSLSGVVIAGADTGRVSSDGERGLGRFLMSGSREGVFNMFFGRRLGLGGGGCIEQEGVLVVVVIVVEGVLRWSVASDTAGGGGGVGSVVST